MRSWVSTLARTCGGLFGALLAVGCRLGVDEERPWNLGERRQFISGSVPRGELESGQLEIYVPLGVEARQLALSARDALSVQRGALVHGVASSLGTLTIEGRARVGSLYALGDAPVIGERARLNGYLRSRLAPVPRGVDARLGSVTDAPPLIERFSWHVAPAGAAQSRCAPPAGDGTLALEPGAYGELVIGAGAHVALRTGHYQFSRVSLHAGGMLELDNLAGPIYVWIAQALEMQGQPLLDLADGNVLFGYAGSAPIEIRGFEGTLVAPAAEVRVRAGAPTTGAIFAAAIVIDAEAAVLHRPFAVEPPDADVIAVCQRCARETLESRGALMRVKPECVECPMLRPYVPRRYQKHCAVTRD